MKEEMYAENPKMIGSKLVDCVPQVGPCPNNCEECYYQAGFYVPHDQPIMPAIEKTIGKIVRVNSGNDSNHHRNYVIEATACYEDKYFNTSRPRLEFPAPVVFTCNGQITNEGFIAVSDWSNLLYVRVRANTWNVKLAVDAAKYYTSRNVPIMLTWMRYSHKEKLRRPEDYIFKKHILHDSWRMKTESKETVFGLVKSAMVGSEYGNPHLVFACGAGRGDCGNSLCKDCHNCYDVYWNHIYGRYYRLRDLARYGGSYSGNAEAIVRKLRADGFYPEKTKWPPLTGRIRS